MNIRYCQIEVEIVSCLAQQSSFPLVMLWHWRAKYTLRSHPSATFATIQASSIFSDLSTNLFSFIIINREISCSELPLTGYGDNY